MKTKLKIFGLSLLYGGSFYALVGMMVADNVYEGMIAGFLFSTTYALPASLIVSSISLLMLHLVHPNRVFSTKHLLGIFFIAFILLIIIGDMIVYGNVKQCLLVLITSLPYWIASFILHQIPKNKINFTKNIYHE